MSNSSAKLPYETPSVKRIEKHSPVAIASAEQQLRRMMEAMYEGRSVRTPAEFRQDLAALHTACDVLQVLAGADR